MRRLLLLLTTCVAAHAADLTLVFQPRWQGKPLVVPSAPLTTTDGQQVRITRWSALVSLVTLTRADGSVVQLPGQYGWIDAARSRFEFALRNVPSGDYVGLGFEFGLPPAVNHATAEHWPAGHPLNPLTDHLYWDWQGGYVFLALEGRWRNPASTDESGFVYHVAGGAHVMPVHFAAVFAVRDHTVVTLAVELSRVLANRRLSDADGSESTHSGANDTLVPQLVTAVRHATFWLGVRTEAAPPPPSVAASAPAIPPEARRPLAFTVPAGFPVPQLPADNPLTDDGMALGQFLFTDKRLSGNGTQSCASCHSARHAFSDTVALSRGADGAPGRRNAMPLFNLAWSPRYAWDGSKPRIRDQAMAAMSNPVEMDAKPTVIVARLNADPAVRRRFEAAFGTPEVTADRIALALEQCLLADISADSKFDRARRGEGALTEEEKQGFALFMTEYDPARGRRGADCFHCHGGPLFTDYDYKNNGLDAHPADPGRMAVTGRADDAGKFKTPSLRNVAVTAPYMHDGRFRTLEQVIAHYDHGVARSPTLDPNLAKHPAAGMQLTTADQRALVAFLRTLTDPRWAAAAR